MKCGTIAVAFVALTCAGLADGAAQARRDNSETVMVTCRPRPGAEADLERVLARHWDALRRLDLARESPHVRLRGRESGQPFFVEIFTWRDADIPDNAPAEVQALWGEMNALVEKRNGRDGIEIAEMSLLSPADPPKR